MTGNNKRLRHFPNTVSTTSFVKLYMLHILNEQRCYGNQLRDIITERLNGKWSPSPGMIYPLLSDMEKEGYIIGEWDEPEKRSIKRYNITDKGREHYKVLLRNNKGSFLDSLTILNIIMEDLYKE